MITEIVVNTIDAVDGDRLPALIDEARARLEEAKSSAELLEARKMADLARGTEASNETQADCLRKIRRLATRRPHPGGWPDGRR